MELPWLQPIKAVVRDSTNETRILFYVTKFRRHFLDPPEGPSSRFHRGGGGCIDGSKKGKNLTNAWMDPTHI